MDFPIRASIGSQNNGTRAAHRLLRRLKRWVRTHGAIIRVFAILLGIGFCVLFLMIHRWEDTGKLEPQNSGTAWDRGRPPPDNRPSLGSQDMGTKVLCLIVDPREAMEMGGKLGAQIAAISSALQPLYTQTNVLMASDKCPTDGTAGPASTCHRRMLDLMKMQSARSPKQESPLPIIEWLPQRPSPPLDVSQPVAASLMAYQWLKNKSPACAAAHFLTPFLASFAAAARRQWHALQPTSIVVNFSKTGPAALLAAHRTPSTIEELEMDFMAASAASDADAVAATSLRVAEEVKELISSNIGSPQRRDRGLHAASLNIHAFPPSAPALSAADSISAAMRAGVDTSTTETVDVVFWGPLTISGGLVRFCKAMDSVVHSCRETSNGISSRQCPTSVRFVGADDGPLGDAVLHASDGMSGSGSQRGSKLALQHLQKWGLPTSGAVMEELEYEAQITALYMPSSHQQGQGVLQQTDHQHLRHIVVIAADAGSAGGSALAAECLAAGLHCVMLGSVSRDLQGTLNEQDRSGVPSRHTRTRPDSVISSTPASSASATLNPIAELAQRISGAITGAPSDSALHDRLNPDPRLLRDLHRGLPAGHPPALGGVSPQDVLMGADAPLVTICLVHYNRPNMLLQAMTSLVRQTYPVLELVIVDNGSDMLLDVDEALEAAVSLWRKEKNQRVQVIRLAQHASALGTARNEAAKAGSGKYLMFMDDDNYAKSNEVAVLLRAIVATGAAAVTCGDDYFDTHDAPPETVLGGGDSPAASGRWMPIGAAVSVGLFRDGYGDANALVESSAFWKIGGFKAPPLDSTGEDWELFASLCLAGHDLQVVPEALFWYRRTPGSLGKSTSKALYWRRTLQPYTDLAAGVLRPGLLLARSLALGAIQQHGGDDATQPGAQEVLLAQLRRHKARCHLLDPVSGVAAAHDEEGLQLPPNLVQNPGFDRILPSDSQRADEWSFHGQGYSLVKADPGCIDPVMNPHGESGPCDRRLRLSNPSHDGSEQTRGAHQVILVDQHAAAPLFVGGWSAAWESGEANDDNYSLYIDLRYKDGSEAFGFNIPFQGGTHGMMAASAVIIPAKPVAVLSLYCLFRLRSEQVEFDNIVVRAVHPDEVCKALAASASHAEHLHDTSSHHRIEADAEKSYTEGRERPPPLRFMQDTLLLM